MKPFSFDEDRIIRRMVRTRSNADIARTLFRSESAIKQRLEYLGIVRTEEQRTINRTKPPVRDPTPEEFLARIAEVQSRWTPEDWAKRATCRVVAYEVPVVWIGE